MNALISVNAILIENENYNITSQMTRKPVQTKLTFWIARQLVKEIERWSRQQICQCRLLHEQLNYLEKQSNSQADKPDY